jgi:hypothetical protein
MRPAGQIRRPCNDEKLPTTAARVAAVRNGQLKSKRSRRTSDVASARRTKYHAIWKPQKVFSYWTT